MFMKKSFFILRNKLKNNKLCGRNVVLLNISMNCTELQYIAQLHSLKDIQNFHEDLLQI
jgi:hypothetical protein